MPPARVGRPSARPSTRDRLTVEAIVAVAPPQAFRIAPDGRRLAYLDEIGGARQVCILTPGRTAQRQQLTAFAADCADPQWAPDGARLAFVKEGAVWVIDADGGRPTRVAAHPAGNESPVWAPDGERLAFVSRRRGWSQLWLVTVPRPARGRPPADERPPDAACLTPTGLDVEHPAWSPDGRSLAFDAMHAGDPTTRQVCVIDVARALAGADDVVRVVAGEASQASGPAWFPDGRWLAVVDDRDGWCHIWRVPAEGTPDGRVRLTSGEVEHGDPESDPTVSPRVSANGRQVLHVRVRDAEQQLVVTWLDARGRPTGREERIDPEPGIWRIVGWGAEGHVAAVGDSTARPQDLWWLPVPGLASPSARPRRLTDSLPGAVPVHRFVGAERVGFDARDGQPIHGLLWRPVDAREHGRRVPVVVDAHGGPTAQRFAGWFPFFQLLVQEGMAVLSVDFRGSTGYGRAFRRANVGEWGHADCHDIIDAARWAAAQPWCDGRLAMHGGSYGGYLTLSALVEEPALWRAGVDLYGDSEIAESYRHGDRVGRIDLERQMGRPDDPAAAEAYRRGSPVYRAERIQAPLLILHGRRDKRVVPLMTERMVEALEIEGKHHEVHWYEDEAHGWQRREDRRDAYERILAFLKRFLLEEEPASGAIGAAR